MTALNAGDSGLQARTIINEATEAISGNLAPLNQFSHGQSFQTCLVEMTAPTPGNAATLATITGAGVIRAIQLTVSYGDLWKHGRIQVFTDGEVLPSIDVDIGTFFGTAYDGTTNAIVQGNDHITTSPATNANGFTFGTDKCWSGALKFPIPYSNGCIIKLHTPTGMTTTGGYGKYFSQIAYQTGPLPTRWAGLRLKSTGIPNLAAVAYTATEQITWLDKPNCAGWVVFLALASVGAAPTGGQLAYGFLERQGWIGVDGEDITPNGNGAINTAYGNSGGEDWFYAGYYFAGQTKITTPDTIVTCANNANRTACMSVDFMKRHGGVRFNTAVQAGWSRKDGASGNGFTTGHTGSYQFLYYIDTGVPFVPSAPQAAVGEVLSSTSLRFAWSRPKSDGSSFLAGYTITLSPGGAIQTVAANVLTADFTGLTNGVAYTASITANSGVGSSTPATAVQTPAAPLAEDSFVRANGNVVGSTAPTGGQTYTQLEGSFSPLIVSNVAKCNTSEANNTSQTAGFDVGVSDMTVSVTGAVPTGVAYNWGPIARFNTGSAKVSAGVSGGLLKIYVNNVERGSASVSVGSSAHTIRLIVQGLVCRVYWDGVLQITYTLTAGENTAIGAATKAGFNFYKNVSPNETGVSQISNFKVEG